LPGVDPYEPKVYQKAADNLTAFKDASWLVQDEQPAYYLYQLTMDGRSQTGLVVCTSIDDYISGQIKKHEFTRPEKEIDRINHVLACDANTSPIFLSYRQPAALKEQIDAWQAAHPPIYDFASYHDVQHRVWLVDDPALLEIISGAFADVDALYIADGHHRTESAVKVGLQKREAGQSSVESERFLSILFPENELAIWEYNRVLRYPVPENFFEDLSVNFTIEQTTDKKPAQAGTRTRSYCH